MLFADQPELNEALARILARAMTDAGFRALCLADPAAAFAEVAGGAPPQGLSLRFKSGEGLELVVGLPEPRTGEAALSDRELERVAGGASTGRCDNTCIWESTQDCN